MIVLEGEKVEEKIFFLDLFCGAGGLSLGLKLASDRYECVGAIDHYQKAIDMFRYNFGVKNKIIIKKDLKTFSPQNYDMLL